MAAASFFAILAIWAVGETFVGFSRMIQWTDWYVLTSNAFASVTIIAVVAPLLVGAGALFALRTSTSLAILSVFRLIFLVADASLLIGWIWLFHQWRVLADFGPDLEHLHWPGSAKLPLHAQMFWSYWGIAVLGCLAVIFIVPAFVFTMRRAEGRSDAS